MGDSTEMVIYVICHDETNRDMLIRRQYMYDLLSIPTYVS
jgi:hypothetical protein